MKELTAEQEIELAEFLRKLKQIKGPWVLKNQLIRRRLIRTTNQLCPLQAVYGKGRWGNFGATFADFPNLSLETRDLIWLSADNSKRGSQYVRKALIEAVGLQDTSLKRMVGR